MSEGLSSWGIIGFVVLLVGLGAWFGGNDSESAAQGAAVSASSYYADEIEYEPTDDPSYYSDPYDAYEYNYRTGYSGSYGYNYDVSGISLDDGGYVYGNVDTQDKYGEGYVYDDYGNELYVETEWVDYGVMEATDEYGNTYELETD